MGAVNLDGAHREAARRKIRREISGLIASGKIEQRRALDETVGREAREITGVAARRADISEPGGAGRLPRAVADGEHRKRSQLRKPAMPGDGMRCIGTRHQHRLPRRGAEIRCRDRFDPEQGGDPGLVSQSG